MFPIQDKADIDYMFRRELAAISKDSKFTFVSSRKQYFSLPPDVISYLLNNPSTPGGLQKLFQTCKYFFAKRQILVFHHKAHWYGNNQVVGVPRGQTRVYNYNKKVLFWFTGEIFFYGHTLPRLDTIYRCSINDLSICRSKITFTDFQILVSAYSKIKEFRLSFASIQYLNGDNVPIDVLLQMLPRLEKLSFENEREDFSNETLQKLVNVKFLNPLRSIYLRIIKASASFSPSLLCQFVTQNLAPTLDPQSSAVIIFNCVNAHIMKGRFDAAQDEMFNSADKQVEISTQAITRSST